MVTKILVFSGAVTGLFWLWELLRTRHFVPVLTRALQHIEEQADSPYEWPISVEIAMSRLEEVQQYQGRIWIFTDTAESEYWEARLTEIVQEYANMVETGDLQSATSA